MRLLRKHHTLLSKTNAEHCERESHASAHLCSGTLSVAIVACLHVPMYSVYLLTLDTETTVNATLVCTCNITEYDSSLSIVLILCTRYFREIYEALYPLKDIVWRRT